VKKYLCCFVLALSLFAGCTAQDMAKEYGGTVTITVPADEKFVNITWKTGESRSNLWVLTRKRVPSDTKETYKFHESSAFGLLQGTVLIVEK